jgi:Ca2+-binding RTX toxin-like protein
VAAIAGVALAAAIAVPGTASAAGCPSEQSVLPYSKNDPPYQCAQERHSGKKSIGAWDTKSWNNTTALGYNVKSHCYYRSDGDVTVTEAWASATYTATATNWDTGTRHWAAGVLFTTGGVDSGGYSNGCDSHGGISNSIERISSLSLSASTTSVAPGQAITFTASVSPSDATGGVALRVNGQPVAQAPLSGGVATLRFTPPAAGSYKIDAAYGGDTSACPQRGEPCGFTPAESKKITVTVTDPTAVTTTDAKVPPIPEPPSEPEATPAEPTTTDSIATTGTSGSATTSSAGADDAPVALMAAATNWTAKTIGLVTQTRTRTMPAALSLRCPAHSVLMHADTLVSGSSAPHVKVVEGLHGARVLATNATNGQQVSLQVTCRHTGLPRLVGRPLGYGTERADHLSSAHRAGVLFGGPGRDHLHVRGTAGVAFGGLGDDRITVAGADGVGTGGAGDDRLVAAGAHRALLVGGAGHDTLVAGHGRTVVNAADGERDHVVCASPRNRVLVDRHDVVTGPCRPVRR